MDLTSVHSLLSCIPPRCSSQVSNMFIAAVVHTLHTIWISRNNLRFSVNVTSIHAAKIHIHSLVALSGNVSTSKCLASDYDFLFCGLPSYPPGQGNSYGDLEDPFFSLVEG